jgi:hypothetical protein
VARILLPLLLPPAAAGRVRPFIRWRGLERPRTVPGYFPRRCGQARTSAPGLAPAPGRFSLRSYAPIGPGCTHPPSRPGPYLGIMLSPEQRIAVLAAAGLEPLGPYPGYKLAWLCRCLVCGAIASPRFGNLRSGQGGCIPCGTVKSGLGRRVDAEEAAALMRQYRYEPLKPYPGGDRPWRCQCQVCGTVSTPRYDNVRLRLQGCPTCANRQRAALYALPADEAEASMRAADLEPLEPYPGSTQRPWRCRCLGCGDEVAPHLGTIRQGVGGCWRCGNRKSSRTQLANGDEAQTIMLAADLKPLEPYPGHNVPWHCRCLRCGSESTPIYGNVKRLGTACRHCATSGFKVGEPAWVYLVERPADGVRQYGVTNEPEVRLGKHRAAGFTVIIELLACEDGYEALQIEDEIRRHLRTLGVGSACTRWELASGGWTETFPAASAPGLLPSKVAPPF